MRKFLVILTCLLSITIQAQNSSFLNLFKGKKISINAEGLGGHSGKVLRIFVKNNGKAPIKDTLNAGLVFICEDGDAQSLMVMEDIPLALGSFSSTYLNVYTNCIVPSNYSPYKGSKFSLDTIIKPELYGLAQVVSKNKLQSYSQGNVWSLIRKDNVVFSDLDSVKAWPMFQYLSQYVKTIKYNEPKGTLPPNYTPPRPKYPYSVRVNITANIFKAQKYSLICTDTNGKELQVFYKDKVLANTIYNVTLGFNDLLEDTTLTVIFKMIDEAGNIVYSKKVRNNHMDEKPQFYLYKTQFDYTIPYDIKNASLKMFDPDGNVFNILYENRQVTKGTKQAPLSFYHYFDKNTKFFVYLYDGEKRILEIPLKPITHVEVRDNLR
jgi:hypothetical protein